MEDKDKLDKAIKQAIRQVGKERDAEDLATLKQFMHKKLSYDFFSEKECLSRSSFKLSKDVEVKRNKTKGKIIYVISSIAAIIAIVFSLNIYQDNRRMDKLFETYYTPLEYDNQLMSRGEENISPELTSAMEFYQKEDYATASQKFEAIPNIDENYLIYKAICLLETEQTEDAVTLLEQLVANGESTEYYQQACWYLALAYLRNHDECKFFEIVKDSSDINFENIKYLMNHD